MINENLSAPLIVRLMNRATHADSRIYHLTRTHVEHIGKDIDGITCHVGMDGDFYYRLSSDGKEVTAGMNSMRMLECIPKLLSLQELCSLLDEECPSEQTKKTTCALFANYEYYDIEEKKVLGSMGYTFGGDYDESRYDYEPENEEKEIEEYRNNLISSTRELGNGEEDGYIDIFSIEKKTFTTTFDKNGEVLESEEDEDGKEVLCYIVNCSEATAGKYGFLDSDDYRNAEVFFTFDN